MKINCQHWEDVGLRDAGGCALGKFRGRPSHGTCAICLGVTPSPTPVNRPVLTILTLEQKQRVQAHRAVCEHCEHAKGFTQVTVKCEGCGCSGVSLLNGKCPQNKWAVNSQCDPDHES